ncbi:MAG: adenosylmethionine decarboxylase [Candidatus Omnitrophota bacterium]
MKKGFYCKNDNITYAGTHLLIELWGAKNINSVKLVKKTLLAAVKACDVTLLSIDLHRFSPFNGISGVAVIKESHITIHTWPEFKYAALDIFVCGNASPYKAISVFKNGFKPKKIQIMDVKRGIFDYV